MNSALSGRPMNVSDGRPQYFDAGFVNNFRLVDADPTGMAEFEFEILEEYSNFSGI